MGLIAIIPARKNSKGIRYKKRLKINGESITRLAIKKAISFDCEYVVLTSDDNYLCKENQDLAYIIKRPSFLSGDKACSFKVWQHALSTLIKDTFYYANDGFRVFSSYDVETAQDGKE